MQSFLRSRGSESSGPDLGGVLAEERKSKLSPPQSRAGRGETHRPGDRRPGSLLSLTLGPAPKGGGVWAWAVSILETSRKVRPVSWARASGRCPMVGLVPTWRRNESTTVTGGASCVGTWRERPWFLPLACGGVKRPLAPASPPTSRLCVAHVPPNLPQAPQKASAEDLCFQPTTLGYPISVAGTTFYPARPIRRVYPSSPHPTIPSILAPGPLNLSYLCLLPVGPHGPSHTATSIVHLAPNLMFPPR